MKRIDMMKLHTEDLKRIGHTVFSEGTNTIFLCSIDTVNMEATLSSQEQCNSSTAMATVLAIAANPYRRRG